MPGRCDVADQRTGSGAGADGELEPGLVLPLRRELQVRIDRVLGRGGMGVVYLVTDSLLGRQAALKLVRGQHEPARAARFRREIVVTARLDHPGIPPVYEAGVTPHGPDYLLMRFVDGESLAERLTRLGGANAPGPTGPAVRELVEALVRVTEAVAHAHSRGITRRAARGRAADVGRGRHG